MKFLYKDSNFNQVIMLNEFELLERPLMVEMIRLKQTPRKSSNPEQMSELIISKLNCPINLNIKFKFYCSLYLLGRCLEEDMDNFVNTDIGIEFADLIIVNESTKPIYVHKCIL